jgi:hypothetical protein
MTMMTMTMMTMVVMIVWRWCDASVGRQVLGLLRRWPEALYSPPAVRALLLERLSTDYGTQQHQQDGGSSRARGGSGEGGVGGGVRSQQLVEALALIMSATGEHRRSLELRVALVLAAKRAIGDGGASTAASSETAEELDRAVEAIFGYMEKYRLQTVVYGCLVLVFGGCAES